MNAQLSMSLHRARLEAAEQARINRLERDAKRDTGMWMRGQRPFPFGLATAWGLAGWMVFYFFWSVL